VTIGIISLCFDPSLNHKPELNPLVSSVLIYNREHAGR